MFLYASGLVLGLGAGFAMRGKLGSLGASIRLRYSALLYLALGAQILIAFGSRIQADVAFGILLGSYVCLIVWLGMQAATHSRLIGLSFAVIAAGTLLNFIAIAPNRGIPVSMHAIAVANAPGPGAKRESFKHVPASSKTVFNQLGDIIPIAPINDVISFGDLLVGLGIAMVIAIGMRTTPSPEPDAEFDEFAKEVLVTDSSGTMSEEVRHPTESSVVLSQAMSLTDANLAGNVHGGVIMKLVDTAAGLSAVKHAHGRVVTVSMDEMSFLEPVFLTDVVTLRAQVNDVGRTSMEVGVRVEAENSMTGEKRHVSSAYLVFVALDNDGKPRPVPRLEPQTDEERARMEDAKIRRRHRIARKEALAQRSTRAAQSPAQ
ncbi:MAG: hotdog domain-containing protein [Actinomycetota bacterium]